MSKYTVSTKVIIVLCFQYWFFIHKYSLLSFLIILAASLLTSHAPLYCLTIVSTGNSSDKYATCKKILLVVQSYECTFSEILQILLYENKTDCKSRLWIKSTVQQQNGLDSLHSRKHRLHICDNVFSYIVYCTSQRATWYESYMQCKQIQ